MLSEQYTAVGHREDFRETEKSSGGSPFVGGEVPRVSRQREETTTDTNGRRRGSGGPDVGVLVEQSPDAQSRRSTYNDPEEREKEQSVVDETYFSRN